MHVHLVAASSLAGAFELLDGQWKNTCRSRVASLIQQKGAVYQGLSQ